MSSFGTITAVLDFAIEREQEAVNFYGSLAGQATNPSIKKVFLSFAKEEQGHKKKLQEVKSNKSILVDKIKVTDLKIGDYLVNVDPQNIVSFQDALVVAIKREKAAMELYTAMSTRGEDPALRDLFKKLAHEESTHKIRFETMYEEHYLPDN